MKANKKTRKQKEHVPYNKKEFVAKGSINSMSAIHTKILSDGTAVVRLSDCHGSIKWHNSMNDRKEIIEFLEKIDTTIRHLQEFRKEIDIKLNKP